MSAVCFHFLFVYIFQQFSSVSCFFKVLSAICCHFHLFTLVIMSAVYLHFVSYLLSFSLCLHFCQLFVYVWSAVCYHFLFVNIFQLFVVNCQLFVYILNFLSNSYPILVWSPCTAIPSQETWAMQSFIILEQFWAIFESLTLLGNSSFLPCRNAVEASIKESHEA